MLHRLLITLALLLTLAAPAGAGETLRVYGDDKYAPIVHLKNGKPGGYLVELLRRAEALTGDRYDIELMPWKRAYELAKRGEAGLLGVSLTQERLQWFDYSEPLYQDSIHLVVRRSQVFRFERLADLQGKVIGGVTGASYGDEVDQAIRDGLFTMERDLGVAPRLRKLLLGRMDGAFVGNGLAGYEQVLASDPTLNAQRDDLLLLPKPVTTDPLYLAFPKALRQQAALQRLNQALQRLNRAR
jgi:ABC-type amino acid transport substrate-binding protein